MFTFEQSTQNRRFTFILFSLFPHISFPFEHIKSGPKRDRFVLLDDDCTEVMIE